MRKVGIVLYALLMTFLQSHYITAQLYPDPLDRVMAAWSREDVAAIMQSEAYRRSSHSDHAPAQALVRTWY
ncbi:MAG: hypothetical protein ACREJ0_15280 [Geminicoccaceae bacterium]